MKNENETETTTQSDTMKAFNKMQKKFENLMSMVSAEEERFREIEQRHMFNQKFNMEDHGGVGVASETSSSLAKTENLKLSVRE